MNGRSLSWIFAGLLVALQATACSSGSDDGKRDAMAYQPPPQLDCRPNPFPQDGCGDPPAPGCLRLCSAAERTATCCVVGARCIERDPATGCETIWDCTSRWDGVCSFDGRNAFCLPPHKPGDQYRLGYFVEYLQSMPKEGWPCSVEGASCGLTRCDAGKWRLTM